MKPETFTQVLILLAVGGAMLLSGFDKPVPAAVGLLIGYLLPSPVQTIAALNSPVGTKKEG